MMKKNLFGSIWALTAAMLLASGGINAQTYPSRPITLVNPYAAGGGGDALVRPLAKRMGELLGQSVVVENRPGAGQTIGSALVARSSPNGYTLLAHFLPNHVNAYAFQPNLSYHPIKNFVPVAQIATGGPLILLVRSDSNIANFGQLQAAARAKPGFSYGSNGKGSSQHLLGELLHADVNLPWMHVPFQGGAPALNALLGGHIDSLLADAGALATIQGGKVRALAVSTPQRLPQLPDVPTFAEMGVPRATLDTALCIFAPEGVPSAVVDRLAAVLREINKDSDLRQQFSKLNFDLRVAPASELQARMDEEAKRYWPLIERLGLGTTN